MDVSAPDAAIADPGLQADWTALADAGWPAIERRVVGAADGAPIGSDGSIGADRSIGWVARFSHGVTRRANSVYPVGEVADEDAAIAVVESWYRERGLPPTFQITDDDAELASALVGQGYVADSETPLLVAGLATVADALAGSPTHAPETTVAVTEKPDADWLDLWWAVDGRGGPDELEVARRIVTGGSALYATVRDARGAASVGRLALVEQNGVRWGGLYALATRADARGRGHARSVIAALLEHAARRGATALWLQVMASNAVARRLYNGLGFRQATSYRYLSAPSR